MKQKNKNIHEAIRFAEHANIAAKLGRKAKEELDLLTEAFGFDLDVMFKVFMWVCIILFCCASTGEVLFSFEIYEDLASSNADSKILPFVMAAIVILCGFLASDLMSTKAIEKIQQFKIARRVYLGEGMAVAEYKVGRLARKQFIWGILLATGAVLFVLALSYIRVDALKAIDQAFQPTWIDLWLPSILIVIEIVSGLYVSFFIQWVSVTIRIRKYGNAIEKHKAECHAKTQLAVASYNCAVVENEEIIMSKDLEDALYRHENRTKIDENYIDPIEHIGFSNNGQMTAKMKKKEKSSKTQTHNN